MQPAKIETYFAQRQAQASLLVRLYALVDALLYARGDATWRKSEIEVFAQVELEHARTVCAELGVPLVRLCSPSALDVREALVSLGV